MLKESKVCLNERLAFYNEVTLDMKLTNNKSLLEHLLPEGVAVAD